MRVATAIALLLGLVPCASYAQTAIPAGEGSLWVEAAGSHSRSVKRFAGPYRQGDLDYAGGREVGEPVPISVDEDGGEFRVASASVAVRAGLTSRLTVGAYFPFWQRSVLTLETIEVVRTGAGDLWFNAAYLVTPPAWRLKLAPLLEVKTPLSRADFRVLSLPLSEGQFDLAAGGVATWAFAREASVTSSVRYRYRAPVRTTVGAVEVELKPGDEIEAHADVGAALPGAVWLTVGWRSQWASAARRRALDLDWERSERRRLHAVEASAYWNFLRAFGVNSSLAFSTFARVPVAGADMLRGSLLMAGIAWQGQLWDR